MCMTWFSVSLRISSVCTVHDADTGTSWFECCCSIKCLHPNVYVFPCCDEYRLEQRKKTEIQSCLKNTAVVWAQTHIVSIALNSITSHHAQGEVPTNIMGNPVKETVGAVMETLPPLSSQELLFQVESSAYFQIHCHFLRWPKHQKHLICSAALRALFSRDWLNNSAEPARRPRPITGSGQAYQPERERGREIEREKGSPSKRRHIVVQKLHYRNIWYNNTNRSGPYILSNCREAFLVTSW